MNNKKLLIIGGAALVFMVLRNRPAAIRQQYAQQQSNQANGAAGLVNSVLNLFNRAPSGQAVTVRPGSQVYGGVKPSQQTINAASQAAIRDDDPNVNGSVKDWTSTDGLAVNPVTQSPWDAAAAQWASEQYWN